MSKPIRCEKDAPMNPHICCRCRAHAEIRDYMVDLGVDFQYEGTMYFCNMCMRDVIDSVPDALTISKLEAVKLEHMNDLMELQEELTQARRLRDRLNELGITVALPTIVNEDEDESGYDGSTSIQSDGDEPAVIESSDGTAEHDKQVILTGMGTIAFG